MVQRANEDILDISNPRLFAPIYIPWIRSKSRYLLAYGGRDSAKSHHAAMKIVIELLRQRYCKVVCLRKTYSSIKDSQFDTLWQVIEMWGLTAYFDYCRAPLELRCKNGNKVLARGLDKPTKLKSVKDPTIVWVEEADEISYDDFIASDMSIRSSYPDALLQLILTFNSEMESCWINDHFFPAKATYERTDGRFNRVKSPRPDATILHTTYRDNPFCPTERGDRYEELKTIIGPDSNYYKVYCLGLWGQALEGLVFPITETAEVMPPIESCKHYGYGLDFGYSNDPTTLIECALVHGKIYLREHLYKRALVNRMNPITPLQGSIEAEFHRLHVGKYPIYADGAEPKSVQELRNAGFNITGVKKPKGSIAQSIQAMNRYPIVIVGGSPNLKKEIRGYVYKKDREGQITNEPIDAWNHCLDASRYWAMSNILGMERNAGIADVAGFW